MSYKFPWIRTKDKSLKKKKKIQFSVRFFSNENLYSGEIFFKLIKIDFHEKILQYAFFLKEKKRVKEGMT